MQNAGKVKIAFIGAGSASFAPLTLRDILLSDRLNSLDLELCLMDIIQENMAFNNQYAHKTAEKLSRSARIYATASLREALKDADFVITAIDYDRNYYWSMDFHVPRKFGSSQIFGENGGPGGMFHALRNIAPMIDIARTMEELCPEALLINYANPEAKIVEAVSRLTKIKAVGLCHGIGMGIHQLSMILQIPESELAVKGCGLNHFAWFQEIRRKKTGEDLYPLFKEKESQMNKLALWDEIGLSRILFGIYGLWPYPGTNHIGEYIGWAEDFLAGRLVQFYYDPLRENPWKTHEVPKFVYSLSEPQNHIAPELFSEEKPAATDWRQELLNQAASELKPSHEVGVKIMEAIVFDSPIGLNAVNVPNKGMIPNINYDSVVELPAVVDRNGIKAEKMRALPDGITEMIRIQTTITRLVIDAYAEKSRKKLLQALLLDPAGTSYRNTVELINEMCEKQKDILPPLDW